MTDQHEQDFEIEFFNETDTDSDTLRTEAETRIRKLAEGHHDITGASVKIRQPAQGRDNAYEANITIYMSPDNIASHEAGGIALPALKTALSEVERQVRTKREKLRGY